MQFATGKLPFSPRPCYHRRIDRNPRLQSWPGENSASSNALCAAHGSFFRPEIYQIGKS